MLQSAAAIVRAHHEWMDGSGYPDGLSGEAMPLGARIVAVADAYDTLTSTHTARSLAEALNELRTRAGSQFDPRVVEALARLLKTYMYSVLLWWGREAGERPSSYLFRRDV